VEDEKKKLIDIEHLSPHLLRHSFALAYINLPIPMSEFMEKLPA
jgi:integrase|tara:strand:- start:686 stop:817 length:132 start_codon:yes stop_codon:yes gene_type:complete